MNLNKRITKKVNKECLQFQVSTPIHNFQIADSGFSIVVLPQPREAKPIGFFYSNSQSELPNQENTFLIIPDHINES